MMKLDKTLCLNRIEAFREKEAATEESKRKRKIARRKKNEINNKHKMKGNSVKEQ